MKLRSKKFAAIVAAGAVAAVAATSAYAYWTTSGTGHGSAQAGTDAGVVVDGSPADGIAPGGTVPVVSTIHNTSGQPQYIASLKVTISIDDAHASQGCDAADFTYQAASSFLSPSNPFTATVNQEIAAHGAAVVNGTLAMTDTSVSQDGCKGATINLAYEAH